MSDQAKTITVFGSSRPRPGDTAYRLACEVGRTVARTGWTLVNGGYGGTMEASARGAQEAGGRVIGVTCQALGRSGPNAYVTEERPTASLEERLAMLVALGRAYVALPGGTGTLLEVARVWEFAHKGLGPPDRPILLMGSYWQPLLDMIRDQDPDSLRWVSRVTDTDEMAACLGRLS